MTLLLSKSIHLCTRDKEVLQNQDHTAFFWTNWTNSRPFRGPMCSFFCFACPDTGTAPTAEMDMEQISWSFGCRCRLEPENLPGMLGLSCSLPFGNTIQLDRNFRTPDRLSAQVAPQPACQTSSRVAEVLLPCHRRAAVRRWCKTLMEVMSTAMTRQFSVTSSHRIRSAEVPKRCLFVRKGGV